MDDKAHILSGFGREYLPVPLTCFGEYLQPSSWYPQLPCWCRSPAQSKRGLLSLWLANTSDQTYVEDVKDPEKVLLPSGDFVFIALRKYELDHCVPFTLLDDPHSDLHHGSTTG